MEEDTESCLKSMCDGLGLYTKGNLQFFLLLRRRLILRVKIGLHLGLEFPSREDGKKPSRLREQQG